MTILPLTGTFEKGFALANQLSQVNPAQELWDISRCRLWLWKIVYQQRGNIHRWRLFSNKLRQIVICRRRYAIRQNRSPMLLICCTSPSLPVSPRYISHRGRKMNNQSRRFEAAGICLQGFIFFIYWQKRSQISPLLTISGPHLFLFLWRI